MPRFICVDVASAPIADAAKFLDQPRAPKNYGPEAAAKFIAEKTAERTESAGLDLDLARVTAFGWWDQYQPIVCLCQSEDQERTALTMAAELLRDGTARILSYNGHAFDLPLLMRRSRYLGVDFPKLNLDRYRSPHLDLMLELTDRDNRRMRSLGFYVRRLGWDDLKKPLTGEEESRVFDSQRWDDLHASVLHDVEAVRRLASWLGFLPHVSDALVAASDARRGTP